MHETQYSNLTAMTGKAELWRFVRIDMQIPVAISKVVKVDMVVVSVDEAVTGWVVVME